eukprot:4417362-Amphidinium_carterae.1
MVAIVKTMESMGNGVTLRYWTLDVPISFLSGFNSEGVVDMRLRRTGRQSGNGFVFQIWLYKGHGSFCLRLVLVSGAQSSVNDAPI